MKSAERPMTASSMTEFTRASVADRTRISVRGLDPDRWIRKPELLSRSQKGFTELVNLLLKDEIVFLAGSLFGPVVQPGMHVEHGTDVALTRRRSWVQIPPGPPETDRRRMSR